MEALSNEVLLPVSPLFEFISSQGSAKSNEDENQDSFGGVEEFDKNCRVSASDVFSDLFKELEVEEKQQGNSFINLPEPPKAEEDETLNISEPGIEKNKLHHKNKIFIDPLDKTTDRSAALEAREACRVQLHKGQTSGVAPGFVQANIVALPKEHAVEFLEFVRANPKGCPLLAVTEPGNPCALTCAPNSDLRTDIPKYRVWVDGVLKEEVSDASEYWEKDMVGFLLGCSFSWEGVLTDKGYTPRHLEKNIDGTNSNKNVPMYKTNIKNIKSGCFGGEVVVSMRPYPAHQLSEVFNITARYPEAHGSPIHWGDPALIGIGTSDGENDDGRSSFEKWCRALSHPDFGDAVQLREGDVPVFWACGVTSQMALIEAKLPLVVTHAPGHMFICDITEEELAQDV
jgi:uncharacterized protein YcsI (UPF0317 family)